MKPQGSLLCSQQPATSAKLIQSMSPIYLLYPFQYYPLTYAKFFQVLSFLLVSQSTPVCIPLLTHTCTHPHLSHHPWFDHPSSIWWGVQIITLLMQFSPVSCHFLPLRPKYLPQYPQPVLTLMRQTNFKYFKTKLHTHTKLQLH